MSEAKRSADPEPSRPPQRPETPPMDPAVLLAVQRREPEALAELYERTVDRVYGLAWRLLGDRNAAEDVTQEVYLRVYRAADRIDPKRDPSPWVLTIAHNLCRDLWRSRGHQVAVRSRSLEEDSRLQESLPSTAPNPETVTLNAERDRLVREAIGSLPDRLRQVVVLHDFGDLTHAEVAKILGVSHAAVRKRYSRALEQLGEILKGSLE